jgi:hypothetical protein
MAIEPSVNFYKVIDMRTKTDTIKTYREASKKHSAAVNKAKLLQDNQMIFKVMNKAFGMIQDHHRSLDECIGIGVADDIHTTYVGIVSKDAISSLNLDLAGLDHLSKDTKKIAAYLTDGCTMDVDDKTIKLAGIRAIQLDSTELNKVTSSKENLTKIKTFCDSYKNSSDDSMVETFKDNCSELASAHYPIYGDTNDDIPTLCQADMVNFICEHIPKEFYA